MTTFYAHTDGSIDNSGSTDVNAADITLTVHASYAGGTTIPVTVNTGSLTSVITTPGNAQSTVNFPNATNTSPNRKIFKIVSFDDVASPKTITVDVAPTGLTAGTSTGKIGGRIAWPGTSTVFHSPGMLEAGDILEFVVTPATKTVPYLVIANSGSAAAPIIIRGRSGVFPVLQMTQAAQNNTIDLNGKSHTIIEGFVFDSDATSGTLNVITTAAGQPCEIRFCKFIDSFTTCVSLALGSMCHDCEFDSTDSNGIVIASEAFVWNLHVHGCLTGIFTSTDATPANTILNCLIYDNSVDGILINNSPTTFQSGVLILGCTIANNGGSGIRALDATSETRVQIGRCILYENGDAAGEFNVEGIAGSEGVFVSIGYNIFHHSGGAGDPGNFSNFTPHATDLTSDPLFVNAAIGDYSLQAGSPALNAGLINFVDGPISYFDIGAVQKQATGGGSGGRHSIVNDNSLVG